MLPRSFHKNRFLIFGHRGSPLRVCENSLESFEKAFEEGADGVECDVRLTSDKKVFVFHDEKIERLTKAKGFFKNHSSQNIRRLFLKGPKPLRIPTLEVVLKKMGKKGLFYIELKEGTLPQKSWPLLAWNTMKIVQKYNFLNRSMLVSFNHKLIRWIKEKDTRFLTGLNFSTAGELRQARKTGFQYLDCLCPSISCLTLSLMKEARAHSLDVIVWGVNDEKDFRKAVKLNVRGVVSDDPMRMVEYLARFSHQISSRERQV
ncbi:MAG: glycerophosphodiester phosphodiesterase [Chlamydiae bacterium]|nr:glycerophosphodiester phosphodiesterase [Chlamydiota bacterium]MBI3266670.1 glycerophosphodiester phosphodiesterase [Chlamydiota bacterium]